MNVPSSTSTHSSQMLPCNVIQGVGLKTTTYEYHLCQKRVGVEKEEKRSTQEHSTQIQSLLIVWILALWSRHHQFELDKVQCFLKLLQPLSRINLWIDPILTILEYVNKNCIFCMKQKIWRRIRRYNLITSQFSISCTYDVCKTYLFFQHFTNTPRPLKINS